MNEDGLKPCPFCGGKCIEVKGHDQCIVVKDYVQKVYGGGFRCECADCGATMSRFSNTVNAAKEAWNKRGWFEFEN